MNRFVSLVVVLVFMLPGRSSVGQSTFPDASGVYLELDGVFCGWLQSADGGAIVGEVITEHRATADGFPKKHIGAVGTSDVSLQFGPPMGKALLDWIEASFANSPPPRHAGSIVSVDALGTPRFATEFDGALITEVIFPACDTTSKAAGFITVKFKPEAVRYTKGSAKQVPPNVPSKNPIQMGNFQLAIQDLDCSGVIRIEPISIRRQFRRSLQGESGPGLLEPSSIILSIAESRADSFLSFAQSFLVKGENKDEQEKAGTLDYTTSDQSRTLLRITFHNMGIFRIAPDLSNANQDQIKRVSAELYTERIELKYGNFVS
jgi:hypothetical protein